MRNAALYIGADPFTFNDMDIVRKCLDMFGFINIFLDRKNRDPEYRQYFLNYMDRADIRQYERVLASSSRFFFAHAQSGAGACISSAI